MGCWEEINVTSASTIPARGWAKGFVEFTVECDATVTTLSRAYMHNQMVEECLSLYKRMRLSGGDIGKLDRTRRTPCLRFHSVFLFLRAISFKLYVVSSVVGVVGTLAGSDEKLRAKE